MPRVIPCACSLRSTQCAALIALAAATGIARVEWKKPVANSAARASQSEMTDPATTIVPKPLRRYEIAAGAVAPWLQFWVIEVALANRHPLDADTGTHGENGPHSQPIEAWREGATNLGSTLKLARPEFFAWSQPLPTARGHSFPFAVGPPPRAARYSNHRAVGTEVPGDSAARVGLLQRLAHVSSLFCAPTPALCLSPRLAGQYLNPSFALRGEPGFSSTFLTHRAETSCAQGGGPGHN